MPAFIPDASVTLAWCFDDERTAYTELLLDRMRQAEEVIVPNHWPFEVVNCLVQAKKRNRIDEPQIARFLLDLASFRILLDNERILAVWERIRHLAETHGLTAYDAAYLELGQRTQLLIATLDRDLHKAAHAASVPLIAAP